MNSLKKKYDFWVIGIYLVLTVYLMYTIYPIFLIFATSLKQNKEIMSNLAGFPQEVTFAGFQTLFEKENFGQYFLNSFFLIFVAGAILLIVSVLLSYALSRYTGKLSRFLFFFFLAGMMIPLRLGLLSLNDLFFRLHLIDNLWGLIFIYVAMNIPFTMLILTGFIRMIPISMEESAFIDGANTLTVVWKIIIPLIKPAVATVVIYNFLPMWNDVYFPLIFIKTPENRMLMHAVTMFFGQYSTNWNLVFSALTLACLPAIIMYIFCSKYLIKGLMAGAIRE
jgi:raffinose/stachyose/melibiose transport system permease protein